MEHTTIRADTGDRHASKYANNNPLHRLSLGRFHDRVASLLKAFAPDSLLDFGCGEAFVLDELAARGFDPSNYQGLDLRTDAIEIARRNWPQLTFQQLDLFDSSLDHKRFHTVMALEVLEHLIDPDAALERLCELARERLLLTVPNEPWFQLMNLIRGRDFIRLGNHPEHINHWNQDTFADFVSSHAEVLSVTTSFPFVILTARPK